METLKFTAGMPIGTRGRFIAALKNFTFESETKIDIEEQKGLLYSRYWITVTGEEWALSAISKWIQRLNKGKSDSWTLN